MHNFPIILRISQRTTITLQVKYLSSNFNFFLHIRDQVAIYIARYDFFIIVSVGGATEFCCSRYLQSVRFDGHYATARLWF